MADENLSQEEAALPVSVVQRSTSKTIHFIRHAEGTHNKAAAEEGRSSYDREDLMDARLTDFGKQQCEKLRTSGHGIEKEAQLVVVSPLSRAIETALLSIEQVEGVPWVALECVRERAGGHPCDRRRSIRELKEDYPTIDFDAIQEDEDAYWNILGTAREKNDALAMRACTLFRWLERRSETNIAIVTHSAFLFCLFNKALRSPAHLQKWFENGELRTVLLDLGEKTKTSHNKET